MGTQEESDTERRDGGRIGTRVSLMARANDLESFTRLFDLSPTGCRIDSSAWYLSKGDEIVFAFSEEISVSGKIAWRRGHTAGVQFDDPLPDAIARHLRFEPKEA
jgi:hypothetical protein